MKTQATAAKLQFDEANTPQLLLTLTCSRQQAQVYVAELKEVLTKGKQLAVEVKQHRQRRSLDANGMCWSLCQSLAEVLRITKEEVYRECVRRVGPFTTVPIRDDALEAWVRIWQSRGIGWVTEIVGASKHEGYTNVMSYYGSSEYDTKQMSVLIDELLTECKELGIDTISESEKQRLLSEWGK